MATINKVDIGAALILASSDDDFTKSKVELPGHPLAAPANVAVTTSARLPLTDGTRVVAVGGVDGAIYAISGLSDTTLIAAGEGFWCPAGVVTYVPVGKRTDGTLHTHLLVIAAA